MNEPAAALGAVVGTLLIVGVGVLVLVLGLRRRRAGRGGTVLVVVGAVLTVLFTLGALGNLARLGAGG
ncbi:hypothetical protein GCM10009821_00770 [Aeromicrobium halocynthiae]|uniref:DUF4190 domain-containing protein n=1 Tax=Aeromicrobium halocynthiae TaxID=560557 RepID=A0ABN2VQN9_9ACTN